MSLLEALGDLRHRLEGELFPLEVSGVAEHRRARRELAAQLDDYIVPRLTQIDAPLLAVVGGSTGAGKSTLVNSLVGAEVAAPGVLRPTTLAPTLAVNPGELSWFTEQRVLPGLPRVSGSGPEQPGTLRIVAEDTVPAGLALLDAPDIDSVVTANRELAAQLLAAADLWLFVTTSSRYADEVPWGFLRSASERSLALAIVLNRVPAEIMDEVRADLARLLDEHGLSGVPLFGVAELPLTEGRLPPQAVQPIEGWLAGLAADEQARDAVVRQTLSGALTALGTRVPRLADEVDVQLETADALRRDVYGAYRRAREQFDDGMRDGSLLRGEVLARWQEFIGTGEFMRALESRVGRLRDRIVAVLTGRPAPEAGLAVALETGVESLIRDSAEQAAERTVDAWSARPAGLALLERDGVVAASRLGRASPELKARAGEAVRDWQGFVLTLVRMEGAGKRTMARVASFGVNGVGLLLMLLVFAQTAGLSGLEIGIAGGTSVLSQRLLEAIFGDQAVRQLAAEATRDLRERVGRVFDQESVRYTKMVDDLHLDGAGAAGLRAAAAAVAAASGEL
ncbi:ABC transporter [Rhizohabitans arisaemae]|uniref:ABC transporter n=1 Tax=Rhizohabitans arisaemae TaxID=2720610 RepID=UPI0024B0BFF2|nr:ABC transporter [Rhizohabitans arisaemae]